MEFKKLSDVEVVAEPTESANVLIEENGVIKKAPKTAVGGGGEWDAVIHLNGYNFATIADYSFTIGNYSNIKAKWDMGEIPRVMLTYDHEYGEIFYNRIPSARVAEYDGAFYLFFPCMGLYGNNDGATLRVIININGDISEVHISS